MTTKIKTAARTAATKAAKPRVLVDFLTALSLLLTVVSGWSYQLGDIATVVPPEWKPKLAAAGAIATVALQLLRPFLPSPNQPSEPK